MGNSTVREGFEAGKGVWDWDSDIDGEWSLGIPFEDFSIYIRMRGRKERMLCTSRC